MISGLLGKITEPWRTRERRGSMEHSNSKASRSPDDDQQEIKACEPGSYIEIVGTVQAVSTRSKEQALAVEVKVSDATGVLTVIWLGRQKIPGVIEGRSIKVCGRLTCNTQQPTIFNPRYELRPIKL